MNAAELEPCARCGRQDRDVRLAFRPLERDARRDGRSYAGPPFGHEYRCTDVDACTVRMRQEVAPIEGAGGGGTER